VIGSLIGSFAAAWIQADHVRFGVGVLGLSFCMNAWHGPGAGNAAPVPHDAPRAGFWGGLYELRDPRRRAPFNIYALPCKLSKVVLSGKAAMFFPSSTS
jgi:uncharacterized protein